jgi:hypothetical protein
MTTQIKNTSVSCPCCSRPLDVNAGPEEKKIALAVAGNRLNSLRANIIIAQEQIAMLERNRNDKAKMLLAEGAGIILAKLETEAAELRDLIMLNDPFRASRM